MNDSVSTVGELRDRLVGLPSDMPVIGKHWQTCAVYVWVAKDGYEYDGDVDALYVSASSDG